LPLDFTLSVLSGVLGENCFKTHKATPFTKNSIKPQHYIYLMNVVMP